MIGVNVISIAQSVNLSSGQLNNILVLQLPDGTEFNAVVPEAVVDKIYGLANGSQQPQQPAPPQQPIPPPAPPQEVQAMDPKTAAPEPQGEDKPPMEVNWMQLDEEYLPAHLKCALKYLNVPEVLSTVAVRNLLNQIGERFGEEQWAAVQAKYPNGPYEEAVMPQQAPQPTPQPPRAVQGMGLQPPQQQPPRPQAQPPLGQVQWSDGSPMIPGQGNRGPSVAVNEAGFPISGDGSMDPGEVVAGGEEGDEDGVAQF